METLLYIYVTYVYSPTLNRGTDKIPDGSPGVYPDSTPIALISVD